MGSGTVTFPRSKSCAAEVEVVLPGITGLVTTWGRTSTKGRDARLFGCQFYNAKALRTALGTPPSHCAVRWSPTFTRRGGKGSPLNAGNDLRCEGGGSGLAF